MCIGVSEYLRACESAVMSLSECDRQQCKNPGLSSLSGNKGLALWPRCLPVFLLSQMWRLVYLALIEALEILPWHVSAGCCPWPARRRTAERSAQGAIHRAEQLRVRRVHGGGAGRHSNLRLRKRGGGGQCVL